MLFSSHNLGQVKRLASRVIYLEHGQLVADLPVHDFSMAHCPRPYVFLSKENWYESIQGLSGSKPIHQALAAMLFRSVWRRVCAVHHDGIDHLDRAVGAVLAPAA